MNIGVTVMAFTLKINGTAHSDDPGGAIAPAPARFAHSVIPFKGALP
jgi:hypothetical protein